LSKEAKSLAGSYSKIVDANYPDINTVEGICQVNPEILASNIVGTEDFAKRFKELKSQYDATTNCAANVGQAFKNVTFADLTQAPEVIKSMTASIDGDVANVSKVHEQISALAEKMERANKAMKTITKLYHAMCLQGERAAGKSRPK
jgi:alpha-tubulin suppressor-like RCC1 family protein